MTKTPPVTDAKPVAPPSVPPLVADLDAGLRRLKLAAIRRSAPEVLITAKTQRWTPEEVLRTLIETELAARDASNVVNRLKAAAFPMPKTLESFDVAASSLQPKVFDYLLSLQWMGATQSGDHRSCRHRKVTHPDRAGDRRDPRRAQNPLLHRRRPRRNALPRGGRQHRRQDD